MCRLDENLGRAIKDKRGPDGILRLVTEEESIPSQHVKDFKEKVTAHMTSYIMVCKTMPHRPCICITEQRFTDFCTKFFSPHLAESSPAPTLDLIKSAYVQFWREMVNYKHTASVSITEAMDKVEGDALFWQHVLLKPAERHAAGNQGSGYDKAKGPRQAPFS